MENPDVFMTFYGLKILLLNLRRFMTFYDSAETLLKLEQKIVQIKQIKECKNEHYYSAWNILKYFVHFYDIF